MPRPRSDIEPRIVRAARKRFLKEGVDGASLRNIAREAGTSIGMVYYYFPTKDDLFLAVVEERYHGVLEDLEQALARDVPVEERLRRLYQRVGQLKPGEVETLQLVLREALVSSARLDRLLERFQRGHLPLVFATIADGLRDGVFEPTLPPGMLLGCVLAVGAFPQMLRRVAEGRLPAQAFPPADEMPARLVEALLTGVGKKDAIRRR